MKEAAAAIQQRNIDENFRVRECFENQKFEPLTRTWKLTGLMLCTDPSVSCGDLFDPATAEREEHSRWIIDYTLSAIDSEGWTYAFDFSSLNRTGAGDSVPQWNSYVRRRKWKYVDHESVTGSGEMAG